MKDLSESCRIKIVKGALLPAMLIVQFILITFTYAQQKLSAVNLKKEYAASLLSLADELYKHQIHDAGSADNGAIKCDLCKLLHTRASEAVYPFVIAYKISGEKRFLEAAISTGSWLIGRQEKNGSWKETPEEWTGTTTDQLLMYAESWPFIRDHLTEGEQARWKNSMIHAADYLASVMSHEFASINYCATTAATLARMNQLFPNKIYSHKARQLAHMIASKMNEDGFINGEGGSENGTKRGSDLGYEMEMSLWGMAYYARLTSDSFIDSLIRSSAMNHYSFILPDGIMDNSWGSRSNKWTVYGGATSDGIQVLSALLADDDPVYSTAAYYNLLYIRENTFSGLICYGPHHQRVMSAPPCIYPTFAKAKNLAMAYMLEKDGEKKLVKLPSENKPWIKTLEAMNVVQVRTKMFMSTITAYNYKDLGRKDKSKYMHRPSGGAASIVWCEDLGLLQAASQTKYLRAEPMTFPEVDTIACMTPRIEYKNRRGYFTNLYEFDASLKSREINPGTYAVHTGGELRDSKLLSGGIGYSIDYLFKDSSYTKSYNLIYHDDFDTVRIIEPFVQYEDMKIDQTDKRTFEIKYKAHTFRLCLLEGTAEIIAGEGEQYYWSPYPALKAYPVIFRIAPPEDGFSNKIKYSVTLVK